MIVMSEKAILIVAEPVGSGIPFHYACSLCHQRFILPEDRDLKSAAAELLAAFKEHIREQHPADVTS